MFSYILSIVQHKYLICFRCTEMFVSKLVIGLITRSLKMNPIRCMFITSQTLLVLYYCFRLTHVSHHLIAYLTFTKCRVRIGNHTCLSGLIVCCV